MAKKNTSVYLCQECGSEHSKWTGKCTDCGAWNSIVEEKLQFMPSTGKMFSPANSLIGNVEVFNLDDQVSEVMRFNTRISELDRVFGGGLVKGSAILIGGDPGIGKSTILLQTVINLSLNHHECLYISGEESVEQIKLRAQRLEVKSQDVKVASATSLNEILKLLESQLKPSVVIIDSIQTIFSEFVDSAPGTVSQVRTCAFELIRVAKQKGISIIFVGHVTKEGNIAGPKVLEHMVDTVLYFEGERGQQFRILRAVKNRFGPANEIGVFEMNDSGLREVTNPSELFMPKRDGEEVSGSCIFAGIEGTRPVLLEIQALVVPSFLATPRQATVGWDSNRLAMMIAVLNSRYGINLLDKEVYLNVAGGLKITEPATDLAVMAALISAAMDIPIDRSAVFFGEVGLSGELRPVTQTDLRINEAEKLGLKKIYLPKNSKNNACKIDIISLNHIRDIHKIFK